MAPAPVPAVGAFSATVVKGDQTYIFFNTTDAVTDKPTIQFFTWKGDDGQRDTVRIKKAAIETDGGPIAAATCTGANGKLGIRLYYVKDNILNEVGLDEDENGGKWRSDGMTATGTKLSPGSVIVALGMNDLKPLGLASKSEVDTSAVLRLYYYAAEKPKLLTVNNYNSTQKKWIAEYLLE